MYGLQDGGGLGGCDGVIVSLLGRNSVAVHRVTAALFRARHILWTALNSLPGGRPAKELARIET